MRMTRGGQPAPQAARGLRHTSGPREGQQNCPAEPDPSADPQNKFTLVPHTHFQDLGVTIMFHCCYWFSAPTPTLLGGLGSSACHVSMVLGPHVGLATPLSTYSGLPTPSVNCVALRIAKRFKYNFKHGVFVVFPCLFLRTHPVAGASSP